MIHTLTGNLLAEHTLTFDRWSEGRTQRAQSSSFRVGGKGINVVRMLHRLGAPATAWYFSGGGTGAACTAWLVERGIATRAFETGAPTRIGAVVRAAGRTETTFLGPDAAPSPGAVRACADALDALPAGQVLAVCGSFPGAADPGFAPLHASLEGWARRGVLVADTYGAMLERLLPLPLALVKVNREEFFGAVNARESETPAALAAARRRFSVRQWVVTDGPGPVWFCEGQSPIGSLMPPPVAEVSPTGSGDVLLACLLHGWLNRGLRLPDAITYALPFAAANAAHEGVVEFPFEENLNA